MKVEYTHELTSDTLIIADSQQVRLDLTSMLLAHELLRPKEQLPVLSMPLRALGILLGRQPTAVPPDTTKEGHPVVPSPEQPPATLFTRSMWLAQAFRSAAELLRLEAAIDQRDLASKISRGGLTTLTFAQETGLVEAVSRGVLTEHDLNVILTYARIGDGPHESQRRAVEILSTLARTTIELKRPERVIADHANLYDDYDFILDRAVLIRLMEFGRQLIARPAVPSAVVADDPKGSITQRVETLLELASIFGAIPLAATVPLLDHALEFLLHPWVRMTSKGRLSDEIARIAEQHAARKLSLPGTAPWPELTGARFVDAAVAGSWPKLPPKPTTILSIAAPAWGQPLAADLSTAVLISEEFVTVLAGLLWRLEETTAAAADLYRRAAGERASSLSVLPATVSVDLLTGPFITIPSVSVSIPATVPSIQRACWHANTDTWRLLHSPLARWHNYTHEYVLDDLRDTPDTQYVPTIVEQTDDPIALKNLHMLLPFIDIFDAPGIPAPMTRDSLLNLWGITGVELEALLAQLSGGTNSFMAHALADRLRFIGVLAFAVNGVRDFISPMDGSWYHTRSHLPFTKMDENTRIELGSRANVRLRSEKMGDGTFFLYPFSHIPTSACVNTLPEHIRSVALQDEVYHKPIVVWEVAPQEAVRPALKIAGWRVHPTGVADLVLNNTLPSTTGFHPVYVHSDPRDGSHGHPLYTHRYNAIVSISDPSSPSPSLPTIAASPRYIMSF
jgi:hypothetical protein